MRAIRLTRANWLNDEVAGDPPAVRIVSDDMAHEAVEVHRIAVYAPEHDPVTFVGPEAAAKRLDELTVTLSSPEVAEVDPRAREAFEETLVELPEPELKRPWTVHDKAAWVNWAVHGDHGQPKPTAEEAARLTKQQLMNRYGGESF